jgi:phospholipid/cholesterol/gamma-HCH transport system substrate-binding protein
MNARHHAELKAGLFVNLGVALAMLAILFLGGRGLLTGRSHYTLVIGDAQGLIPGARVLVSGVPAGKVDSLNVDSKTGDVRVDISVNNQFAKSIRQDSYADISSQGVLGDRLITIRPGTPNSPPLPNQALVPVRSSFNVSTVVGRSDELLRRLNHLVGGLDEAVDSIRSTGNGKRISSNAAEMLEHLASVSRKLDQGLDEEKISGSINELESLLSKLNHGTGTLGALINDPSLYDDAKALVGESNRNRIVRNLVRQSVKDSQEAKTGTGSDSSG